MPKRVVKILTNTGHEISPKEDKFIDKYLELGNGQQACLEAGFKTKNPNLYANRLIRKPHICEEIKFRRDQIHSANIASAAEVMAFLTSTMRGEVKDQFNLDAPIAERIKAADMLAKRTIDIDNRMAGKKDMSTPEIQIKLDWTRDKKEDNDDGEEE